MDAMATSTGRIEIKLRKVSQLFSTLDPSPFRESELALEAEDYIVARAQELPIDASIAIVIHLPSDELSRASASDIVIAVKDHFDLRSQAMTREMRELFRNGRFSLAVGLSILSLCLVLGWLLLRKMDESPVSRILQESFLIFGWVAIWKPSDIFLYEWPPMARRRALFRRLAAADVNLDSDTPWDPSSLKEKKDVNAM
ncbi:hypothetical protein [Bradyrhizobium neotropicale]|uniref:Uncharacterized protein n=1 Tax=Bradyrhizobium neotropicale TaxID=1497615 RepID=A0A176Z9S8_9BRAD|nr:hypothetical protein [Bradyrhizobium neotropicale]OAF16526.1 hypothetical protein AXW67_12240 [Bradyrhizobium neotropicale]